jgi:hypothetical protein
MAPVIRYELLISNATTILANCIADYKNLFQPLLWALSVIVLVCTHLMHLTFIIVSRIMMDLAKSGDVFRDLASNVTTRLDNSCR